MPRVNRDLQRRMAARRERNRRPAPERRYNFTAAAPVDAETDLEAEPTADGAAAETEMSEVAEPTTRARSRREGRVAQTERAAARPFTNYALEYAYVASDLRRLGLVVGVILIFLAVLYVALPR